LPGRSTPRWGGIDAVIAQVRTRLEEISGYLEAGLGGDISARINECEAQLDAIAGARHARGALP
jgi:hypothetical protein